MFRSKSPASARSLNAPIFEVLLDDGGHVRVFLTECEVEIDQFEAGVAVEREASGIERGFRGFGVVLRHCCIGVGIRGPGDFGWVEGGRD
jgi:hypothetical protein